MSREDKTRDSNLYDENEAAANALFGDFLSQPTRAATDDFVGAKTDSPIIEGMQIGDPKGDVSFNVYLNELGSAAGSDVAVEKQAPKKPAPCIDAMPEGSLSRAKKSMENGSFNPYGSFNANVGNTPVNNQGAVQSSVSGYSSSSDMDMPNNANVNAMDNNAMSNTQNQGILPQQGQHTNQAMGQGMYQERMQSNQMPSNQMPSSQMQGGFNPYANTQNQAFNPQDMYQQNPAMGQGANANQGMYQNQMPPSNQVQGVGNEAPNANINPNANANSYQSMQQAPNPYANPNQGQAMNYQQGRHTNQAMGQDMYQEHMQSNQMPSNQIPSNQIPSNQMQGGFNPYANTQNQAFNPQNMYQQGQGANQAMGQGMNQTMQQESFNSNWSQPEYDKPDRALEKYTQRIIASYSPKGGTGKSTVAQDLAYLFSHSTYLDKPMTVLLVDYDFTNGNVSARFGIRAQKTTATWGRQLEDTKQATGSYPVLDFEYIENHFVKKVNNNLDVICAPKDPITQRYFTPALLDSMIKSFRKSRYDIILLDCANNVEDTTLELLKMSDDVLLIETIDKAAIEAGAAALATMRELQMDTDKVKLVFNMVPEDKKMDLDTGDIVDMLNVPCIGSIPRNDEVRTSQNALGSLLEMYYPKQTPYVKAYKDIATAIFPIDEKKKKGLFGGLFGKKKGKK